VAGHGVEEIDAGGDVGGVEGAGLADGFSDQGFAGEVHDRINFVLREDFFELRADGEINFTEGGLGRDGGGVALLEIIESDDLVAAGEENLRADTADVACCSGDKNVQGITSPLYEGCVALGAGIKTIRMARRCQLEEGGGPSKLRANKPRPYKDCVKALRARTPIKGPTCGVGR